MIFEALDPGRSGLRVFSPAKINLYLEILGQRPDGYHEIDTLMLAVSLYDMLEFVPLPAAANDAIRLEVDGSPDLTPGPENLVARAALALQAEARRRHPERFAAGSLGLAILLRKRIPMGGGLGGGSSDAAATLLALNRLWGLGWPAQDLEPLAAALGSDVAFFLRGGWARCTGRGERIEPLGPPPELHCILVTPPLHVPTALIYKRLKERRRDGIGLTPSQPLATLNFSVFYKGFLESFSKSKGTEERALGSRTGSLEPHPPESSGSRRIREAWRVSWLNRLQEVAFESFPPLLDVLQVLESEPFIKVLMTGSGATFFGICEDAQQAESLETRVRRRFSERGMACQIFKVGSLPAW